MPEATPCCDARHLEMIEAMTQCAYELGMAAGEIARRSTDNDKLFLAASNEFRQCFFAMRMGIRLSEGGLAAIAAKATAPAAEAPETERLDAEERPERPERLDSYERLETDRDRDYEPVSLARFLKSLGLVAASAEKRRDDLPPHIRDTTLPTLQKLLQQANAPPDGAARNGGTASAVAVLARPPAAPAARSRLLASTVTPSVPRLGPKTTPRRPSG